MSYIYIYTSNSDYPRFFFIQIILCSNFDETGYLKKNKDSYFVVVQKILTV